MRLSSLRAVFVFTLAAFAQKPETIAPNELPQAPGQVFEVTPEPGFQNEPAIAVNANNPQQVFAAYQMPARVVFSQDGGKSWKPATGTQSTSYKISGDVVATYDKKGNAILGYIAFDKLGTENYWARGATRNGIFIRRSTDGGATWEAQDHAVIEQPTKAGIPFEDKPGLASDNTHSKFAGNLYMGWTEFRLDETVILFARSTDGGMTWSQPIDISTHHGLPRDDNGAVEGFSAAVANDGTIYAVWADAESIVMATSKDGGKNFDKSRVVLHTGPLYFAQEGLDRSNGFPQIAIDAKHGKKGKLYVTWSDYRSGDVTVYCATSDDGGKRWSSDVRVSSKTLHDGTDQFFQWLAVDAATGAANVIFYDRRRDPENEKTTVTLARSTDGGATFKNYAWTTVPFSPTREQFLGDYLGIAAFNDKVYGVWAEITPMEKPKDPNAVSLRALYSPRGIVKIGVADFGSAGK